MGGGRSLWTAACRAIASLFHCSPGSLTARRREAPRHPSAEQLRAEVGPLGAKVPVGFEAAQLGRARPLGLGKAPAASGFRFALNF